MADREGPLTPAQTEDDVPEATLRPRRLEEYFGQERIKENLRRWGYQSELPPALLSNVQETLPHCLRVCSKETCCSLTRYTVYQ